MQYNIKISPHKKRKISPEMFAELLYHLLNMSQKDGQIYSCDKTTADFTVYKEQLQIKNNFQLVQILGIQFVYLFAMCMSAVCSRSDCMYGLRMN